MAFKEMDPDVVQALLEGHQDTLTAEAEEEARYLSRLTCAQCGAGEMRKKVRADKPFMAGQPLIQWDAECPRCGCLFDPHTLLIKKAGAFISSE